jgi:hypothetical protein
VVREARLGLEREGALLGDGLVVDGAELEEADVVVARREVARPRGRHGQAVDHSWEPGAQEEMDEMGVAASVSSRP